MDLDELKDQLKNKLATDHAGRSDADIAALLTRKTVSITDRLQRNLWIEIICCAVVIAGFTGVVLFSGYTSFRIYFSVFAVLALVFLVLLIFLLRRIKTLSSSPLPVKANLQTIVNIIEEFAKRYFQFTMALVPVCCFFAFIIGYTDSHRMPSMDRFALKYFDAVWKVIIFLVAYMLLLATGIYFFTKWYLKKQFSRYVLQLKACIAELAE